MGPHLVVEHQGRIILLCVYINFYYTSGLITHYILALVIVHHKHPTECWLHWVKAETTSGIALSLGIIQLKAFPLIFLWRRGNWKLGRLFLRVLLGNWTALLLNGPLLRRLSTLSFVDFLEFKPLININQPSNHRFHEFHVEFFRITLWDLYQINQ